MSPRMLESPSAAGRPQTPAHSLWFKDAVIYQLHVRAFYDSNADGIGDFPGLTQKLDYIQDLGVTTIWLLPFFPSPLRDDGYDIADYTGINPVYGTLDDFQQFLEEAHRRDLRVITEMVMNHTSDQHEWFQKSRRAKPGDKWRDFYVWSDTDERYQEARIIFQDFETSNWTWDPVANAYFWHRFYHHQPDLNFDNPDVHEAILGALDFWLDRGVDGIRLDAVPYLYEREGTNCENLPETHEFLKKLRRHVDKKYSDRMLLAEANQWPEDAAAYFGDGDECHMNFHFPLMPRLFMAIEREDRFPVIDILEQTPQLPDNCQWGIFLRNHDELTLEMVTDEERDYMYRAYAEEPRARVNLGIRRRLAPLLRDNRRKVELMNGLLLSLPGTPIIYYGDEIRMGDNIYLGDRDSVRTPMQWNEDRNAGFSRANPQQLFLPLIIDAPYHYTSRNVEVEISRPHSVLWWMRRIISLRQQHPAFGRGSMEFLAPDNSKVLAYLRSYDDETILVVVNLSRYVQFAELDLSRYRGQIPTEMYGQTKFPPIGELPYFLTLGPYAFYWLKLQWPKGEQESVRRELPSCKVKRSWDELFQGKTLNKLEAAFPAYLARQRWFAGKARPILRTKLLDVLTIENVPEITSKLRSTGHPAPPELADTRWLLVRVEYVEGEPETYVLPVLFAEAAQEHNLLGDRPGAGIITIHSSETDAKATLCDTSYEVEYWALLYDAVARNVKIPGEHGQVQTFQLETFPELSRDLSLEISIHGGEQSNTSAVIGKKLILKMFRRVDKGINPDLEIGRYLTEYQLDCVPRLAGGLEYQSKANGRFTLALLHEFIPNEGDAWVYTLDELDRYLERIESEAPEVDPAAIFPDVSLVELANRDLPDIAREVIGSYLESTELLGKRTAEVHLALAAGTDSALAPEPFTKLYQRSLYQSMRTQTRRTLSLLRKQLKNLPEASADLAKQLLEKEAELLERCRGLADVPIKAERTRTHGDFHLGQVLFTGRDFAIIDFEGEPNRSIGERRIKNSPLKDAAGMIRSFHYAAHAAIRGSAPRSLPPSVSDAMVGPWLDVWFLGCAASFLKAYLEVASQGTFLPKEHRQLELLLNAYLLEKAVYELAYELNNRPDWVPIPLEGILHLIQRGR